MTIISLYMLSIAHNETRESYLRATLAWAKHNFHSAADQVCFKGWPHSVSWELLQYSNSVGVFTIGGLNYGLFRMWNKDKQY